MTDHQLATLIRTAARTEPPPVSELVAGGLARGQSMRRRRRVTTATAAVSVAALSTVAVVALSSGGSPERATPAAPTSPEASTSSEAPTGPCRSETRHGTLPTWARAGFSGVSPAAPHVLGREGRIVAVLFGETLHSPPSDKVFNKILWVSPTSTGESLEIDAVHAGTSRHARREVPGGPGPSTIDLPQPGCWRLDLRWGDGADQHDSMDLVYVRP